MSLDCCSAGYVPSNSNATNVKYDQQPDHIMETLAACTSHALTPSKGVHGFTRRLVGQLIMNANEEGVSVDHLNSALQQDGRYHHENTDHSPENVRICLCGQGSIVLRPSLLREASEAGKSEDDQSKHSSRNRIGQWPSGRQETSETERNQKARSQKQEVRKLVT